MNPFVIRTMLALLPLALAACTEATADEPQAEESTQKIVGAQTCGGIANIQCKADEECVVSAEEKNHPDATGTCTPKLAPRKNGGGSTCGGIAAIACAAGEECVIADEDKSIPDATGTCTK